MSLQHEYENFCASLSSMADEDPAKCVCGGCGWVLSDFDTWHECPAHYSGQHHPEDTTNPEGEQWVKDRLPALEDDPENDIPF